MATAEPVAATVAGTAQALMIPNTVVVAAGSQLSEGSNSLTRRSRVRRTNSRRDEDSSSDFVSTSDEISSGQLFVKIPQGEARLSTSPKSLSALEPGAPPRPPRSPCRVQTAPALENREINLILQIPRQRTRSTGPTAARPAIEDIRGRKTRSDDGQHGRVQRKSRGISLPRCAFRNNSASDSSEQPSPLTPNIFNDIPPIPAFAQNRRFGHQTRDSGTTQQSTVSSSVYPKSTSTEGSYPSPPSLPAQDMDDRHIITVDPADDSHLDALHDMDADEVSYRLRLLMQNNYYLPPAHLKPFSEIPSVDTPKKSPTKAPSPTFFDIFKVGKKKSTVLADNKADIAPPVPILRTTSDSSTLSGLVRPQPSSSPNPHLRVPRSLAQTRQESKGRVVVVRERMEDIISAAKRVEEEMKARETERQHDAGETTRSEGIQVQFVDPTDSVDLPMVSSNEFFGPQAALLRGMGIDSSLGAALLADQLPPTSPGSSSAEMADAAWRRAILHAAVDHSLNNSSVGTPARSTSSSSRRRAPDLSSAVETASATSAALSPSVASLLSSHLPLQSTSVGDAGPSNDFQASDIGKKPIIGQPILSRMIDEVGGADTSNFQLAEGAPGEGNRSNQPVEDRRDTPALNVAKVPARASSPLAPTFPLRPPPRRPSQTPVNPGGSGSDNAQERKENADESLLEPDAGRLQVENEPPLRLSDSYESHVGLGDVLSGPTPPSSQHNSATLSAVKPSTAESLEASRSFSTTSGSHYSDDDGEFSTFHTPLGHTLASNLAGSRPSLGSVSLSRASFDSSQPSPTTSAFRDAYDRSQSASSIANLSDVNTLGGNSRIPSQVSSPNDPRYAFVSPPPRVSSILERNTDAQSSQRRCDFEQEEPGTPTALHVPRLTVRDLLTSESNASPYSASPISFFDAVEMQSHHDEDESSDSDDDEGDADADAAEARDNVSVISSNFGGHHSDSASLLSADPRTGSTHSLAHDPRRAPGALMQQLNASSPQLSSRAASSERSAHDDVERWRGISNVPRSQSRPTFWHKKVGKRHEIFPNPSRVSESTADYLKHEEAMKGLLSGKRPHTAGSRIAGKDQLGTMVQDMQNPSVRRLDGLLVEHMEREKEVLKRITTTVSKPSA